MAISGQPCECDPTASSTRSWQPLETEFVVVAGIARQTSVGFHSLVKYDAKEPATAAMTVTMYIPKNASMACSHQEVVETVNEEPPVTIASVVYMNALK